jgi:hypothetical protein
VRAVHGTQWTGAESLPSAAVTIDTIGPSSTDVQATNVSGGTVGKMEAGDVLTLSYSEAINPATVVSGFSGAAFPVTVRVTKGTGHGSDSLSMWDASNTTQIASLGSVNLSQENYVQQSITFAATMTLSASGKQIVITLGAPSNASKVLTVSTNGDLVWTTGAPAAVKDLAGNLQTNAGQPTTESGGHDPDF